MGGREQRGDQLIADGGIIALADIIDEHGDALEYDLLTILGVRLRDVPKTIGWHSVYVFVNHLPESSALFRSKYPEYAAFASPVQQSGLMAEIVEAVLWLKYDFDVAHSEKGARIQKPKPYPTPWAKEREDDDRTTIGKGAIPKSEFLDWYYGEG